jgi:hypothetical protein
MDRESQESQAPAATDHEALVILTLTIHVAREARSRPAPPLLRFSVFTRDLRNLRSLEETI